MKLTKAQRRGLEAVRDGKAFRTYTMKGNTVHCDGVAASVIWKLEAMRLIGERRGGGIHRCSFGLTNLGADILEKKQ